MQTAMAASRLTRTFSSKARITGFIKFASKEAIPRASLFVFRERPLAVAGGLWAGHVSWNQSRDGMAICRGAGVAGAKARGRIACAAADRAGARAFDWNYRRRGPRGPCECAPSPTENCCGDAPLCFRLLSSPAYAASELGRNASRFRRFDALVVCHGVGTRRRIDAHSVFFAVANR